MVTAEKATRPLLPAFALSIDGKPLSRVMATHVTSIVADDDVELPGWFSFEMAGADDQKPSTSWADSNLFRIGGTVDVRLGYDNRLSPVMTGEIVGLDVEFAADRLPTLTVTGYDFRHRLQRSRRTRTFTEQTDSDIASKIAGEAGLSADVTASRVIHEYLVQANETDFDFLARRAAAIGYELRASGRGVSFGPRNPPSGTQVRLSLQDDLLRFQPRLSAARQVDEVSLRTWSVKDKKVVLSQARAVEDVAPMGHASSSGPATARRAFGAAAQSISAWAAMSQAEADRFVKTRLDDAALEFVTGEGTCWGRGDLRAGSTIEIADVGSRFSGPYYVNRVRHRYDAGAGYITDFTVRRNAL